MNKLLLFALLLCAFAIPAWNQDLRTEWSVWYGENGQEHFQRTLHASNGLIWAVGSTTSATAGGRDGYLVIADYSTGRLVKSLRLGGAKDDEFYDVVQTPDGRFLLAGRTESSGQGNADAWLVLLDAAGKKIKEWTYGTPGNDAFKALALTESGQVVFAGVKNGQQAGDLWVGSWRDGQLGAEAVLGRGEFGPPARMVLAGTELVIMGNTAKGGDVYLVKTTERGEKRWQKTFGEKGWEEGLDLIATADGGYALAGLTRSKGAGDLDAWLVKTNRDGSLLWDKTYGGPDADLANGVVQLNPGGYVLVGSSRSYRSGARKTKALVVRTSSGGDLEWREYFGDGNDDVAQQATLLLNGQVVVAGKTASFGAKGEDGWLLALGDPSSGAVAIRDQQAVKVATPKLVSGDGKTLTPGEAGYLTLRLENAAGIPLENLRLELEDAQGASMVDFWATNYAGFLATGASRTVRIPVQGKANLQSGQNVLNLTVYAGTKAVQSLQVPVETRLPQAASLQIASYTYTPSTRSDEIVLSLQLQNTGDYPTKALEASFLAPAGIQASSSANQTIGAIAARDQREIRFAFLRTPAFRDGSAPGIQCVVREVGVEKLRKTLEWKQGGGRLANGPIMIWTDPAPHELGTNQIKKTQNQFEFKMTVVSPKPLNTKNITLSANGVVLDGSKFDEEELSAPKTENEQYTYTYKNVVPLSIGTTKFEVRIDGQVSAPLFVEYAPERANLHVVAIGAQHPDLKFTGQDARDFAAAFRQQGGADKLYPNVYVNELTTPEATSLTGIKQAMYDLAYQWRDGLIKENDVLLVFISSHGKIVDNRFKLLQTGYNPKYDDLCVDYKTDILETLERIKCKKLIFLDACHSGGAKDGYDAVSKAVIDLAKTQVGLSTLASCRSDEKSYEAPEWANGAFTEALLEAFGLTSTPGPLRADTNNDGVVRLGELYDFLQKRVPQMVQQVIPTAPTSQIPYMPEAQLDRDMPLFLIRE